VTADVDVDFRSEIVLIANGGLFVDLMNATEATTTAGRLSEPASNEHGDRSWVLDRHVKSSGE
jgi:hypothetical protein